MGVSGHSLVLLIRKSKSLVSKLVWVEGISPWRREHEVRGLAAYHLQTLKDKSEGHGPSPALNFKYDSFNTRNYEKEKPLVVPSF